MKLPRFYQHLELVEGNSVELNAQNFRHSVQVLRLREGDWLMLFNGEGQEARGQLETVSKRGAVVRLGRVDRPHRESPCRVTLVLAMIKPDKMDFAMQKAVELGVQQIQPVYAGRSVVRLKSSRLEKKLAHWQGVIINACEQSGRVTLPTLISPCDLTRWLDSSRMHPAFVMLPGDYPSLNAVDERQVVTSTEKAAGLLVGPEGGFTPDEEALLLNSGIQPISFGPRILRAETAVIAGLTAIQLKWGDI